MLKSPLLVSVFVPSVVEVIRFLKSVPVMYFAGMTQLNAPAPPLQIEYELLSVAYTGPPFSSSIFTVLPGFPVYVYLMVCVVPTFQLSPPFGTVTVMLDVGGRALSVMLKFALLVSVIVPLFRLVIRTV